MLCHLMNWHKDFPKSHRMPYNTHIRKGLMTTLNLTERQVTILGIALTTLYDEIAKSNEGNQMREDIIELSRYVQKQTLGN